MQWFIKEQVEEVATMSSLVTVAKRNTDSIADLETYIAREQANAGGVDPTAPSVDVYKRQVSSNPPNMAAVSPGWWIIAFP